MIAAFLNFIAVWVFCGAVAVLTLAAVNRQRGPALIFTVIAVFVIAVLMMKAGDF